MSYYKGKRGEKIHRIWTGDKQGEQTLRDWLNGNGYAQVSLTIFTYLSHHEPARKEFLRAYHALTRKGPPAGRVTPAAGS